MTGFLGKWLKMPTLADRLRAQGVREDLVRAAERTAFGRQTDRELPRLAELITDQELVIQLVEGRWNKKMGLFALTSRRLLFVPAGDGTHGAEVPLPQIVSVEAGKARGMGTIDVTTESSRLHVDQILGTQADTIAANTRAAMNPAADGPAVYRDPLEELAELRALHAAGAVSDEEFAQRKMRLMDQI
ncbi:MAG TPA: SHOCT domain-containing protein [Nakamurella sp.]